MTPCCLLSLQPDPSYKAARRKGCKRWYSLAEQAMQAEAQAASPDDQGDDTANTDESEDTSESQELAAGTQQYAEGQYSGTDGAVQYRHQKKYRHNKKGGRGYGWEQDRYNEDYSCGKDEDDDDASPHVVILVRGTLSLFEWQLGKVTCTLNGYAAACLVL